MQKMKFIHGGYGIGIFDIFSVEFMCRFDNENQKLGNYFLPWMLFFNVDMMSTFVTAYYFVH